MSKTGPAGVVAGAPISYTVTASNAGPNAATAATLTDSVPANIQNVTWSCAASGTASGTGNAISLPVNLPVGQTVTLTVNGTVSPVAGATTLTNTAAITPPANLPDQDFGVFNGGQVSGRVFYDNAGNYVLWLPASLFSAGNLTLSHAQPALTGTNIAGSSAVLATGSNAGAARQRTLAYALGNNYSSYKHRAPQPVLPGPVGAGPKPRSRDLQPSTQARNARNPHPDAKRRRVHLSGAARRHLRRELWGKQLELATPPLSFAVDNTWPRDPDGSLKGCALEVRRY